MSIQKTILNALGTIATVKGTQTALANQQANLDIKKQKLKIAQQNVDVKKDRENRMMMESEARQEYYRGSAEKSRAFGQNLRNKAMLDRIAISALKRSLAQQDMKLTQKQIQSRIKKVRDQLDE